MANFHRGDVDLVLGERVFTLRLTLQSLAEIEAAFALADLGGLGERFGTGRIAAKDLVILLGAAVRGGGTIITDAALAALIPASFLPRVAEHLAKLLDLTFGSSAVAANSSALRAT